MTVAELIEKLREFRSDLPVVIRRGEYGEEFVFDTIDFAERGCVRGGPNSDVDFEWVVLY